MSDEKLSDHLLLVSDYLFYECEVELVKRALKYYRNYVPANYEGFDVEQEKRDHASISRKMENLTR